MIMNKKRKRQIIIASILLGFQIITYISSKSIIDVNQSIGYNIGSNLIGIISIIILIKNIKKKKEHE